MESNYLQYSISSWDQLSKCRSNSDKDLRISVSKYLNNPDINGTTITVEHPRYGILLAYTIQPSGSITLPLPIGTTDVMRASTLLNELKRYGFYVEFRAESSLVKGQLAMLESAAAFNATKVRLMRVYDSKRPQSAEIYVTAFDPRQVPDWMNSGYSCSDAEFSEKVMSGHALNLSTLANADNYSWDWLYNKVIDVYAVLEANQSDLGEVVESPFSPSEGADDFDPVEGTEDPVGPPEAPKDPADTEDGGNGEDDDGEEGSDPPEAPEEPGDGSDDNPEPDGENDPDHGEA